MNAFISAGGCHCNVLALLESLFFQLSRLKHPRLLLLMLRHWRTFI